MNELCLYIIYYIMLIIILINTKLKNMNTIICKH